MFPQLSLAAAELSMSWITSTMTFALFSTARLKIGNAWGALRCIHPATALLVLLAATICSGCGRGNKLNLVDVTGTVTLNGEPLADAEVVFHPAGGGRPSLGKTDASGRYRLEYIAGTRGALPGEHKVSISTFVEPDKDASDPAVQSGRKETVPASYNRQTTLRADLKARSEKVDFQLVGQVK
jgi:hypothetical protein